MLTQLSKIINEKCYECVKILCQNIFIELDLQDIDENLRKEIFTLINNGLEEYVKLVTFGVSSIVKNKDLEKKCVSLEATVKQLKEKLSQNNEQDLFNKTLFNDGDGSSPRTSPNDLNANHFIHSLSSSDRVEENEAENILKTPSSQTSYRATSPVVQKQSRSGKRNKIRFKSNKRYRSEDDSKVDPNPLAEISDFFLIHSPEPKKDPSPERTKDLKDCATPLAELNLSEDDNSMVEPSPAPVGKNRRINPIFDSKKLSSVEHVNNVLSPISQNLLSNRETHQLKTPEKNDNRKEKKPKSKWQFKPIRDVKVTGKGKLKQTTLSTVLLTKSVDISTSNQFKGGAATETNLSCKTDSIDMELTIMNTTQIQQENRPAQPCISSQETIFYPDSPSKPVQKATVFEEADTGFPEGYFRIDQTSVDIPIGTAYQETFFDPQISSTVKEDNTKSVQPVVKNSFDYLPSPKNSPNYKYRRDPLRKKADRQKLPGQTCIHCCDFYGPCIGSCDSNDQLARKVSRHRDKYPLHANTPPGLWNPKFDDTDDSD